MSVTGQCDHDGESGEGEIDAFLQMGGSSRAFRIADRCLIHAATLPVHRGACQYERMPQHPPSERPPVLGPVVDAHTRCVHYRTELDIIAIRFACCGDYYPCHLCHEEAAGHASRPWPIGARDTKAVLCGACGTEL